MPALAGKINIPKGLSDSEEINLFTGSVWGRHLTPPGPGSHRMDRTFSAENGFRRRCFAWMYSNSDCLAQYSSLEGIWSPVSFSSTESQAPKKIFQALLGIVTHIKWIVFHYYYYCSLFYVLIFTINLFTQHVSFLTMFLTRNAFAHLCNAWNIWTWWVLLQT